MSDYRELDPMIEHRIPHAFKDRREPIVTATVIYHMVQEIMELYQIT